VIYWNTSTYSPQRDIEQAREERARRDRERRVERDIHVHDAVK